MIAFPSPLTARAAPLLADNIDTDTIIPSREMRSTGRDGLADGLFAPWRYTDADARTENPDFALNQPGFRGSAIIAGGANFGCGSSREHAVWALAEYGVKAIIAESFAPIFHGNCVRNFLLPITLPRAVVEALAGDAVTIDLAAQTVTHRGTAHPFVIDPEARQMLAQGLDVIDLTLTQSEAIETWTRADRALRPWVYLDPPQRVGEGDHPQGGGGVNRRLPPKTNAAVMRAKTLRRSMPPSELRLWSALKERPGGFKFRRQHPAGDYVLDFYCPAANLCIEVDGAAHDQPARAMRDAVRDRFLANYGIDTLRVAARDVFQNLENVVSAIVTKASERRPLHRPADGPPPQQAGEDT